mmetsp:Transcript_101382/g.295361  ORF Transcript_101382/g.295361 Transcript_101382/m.295361 type:complete len:904 (+) Transcript_101382:97-2808(+)
MCVMGSAMPLRCGCTAATEESEDCDPEPGAPGDPFRALSVHYLATGLLAHLKTQQFDHTACIYELEQHVLRGKGSSVLCPRDGMLGSAYVDTVHGEDNVGRATHMLSYTWAYRVGDIVDALTAYCERGGLTPARTYVWMCCFCINQRKVRDATGTGQVVPFEQFSREFGDRVRCIGHVLALMSPWQAPRYITRVWCVYEMYVALSPDTRCKLDILMPPGESQAFTHALTQQADIDQLWAALSSVRVELAEASVPADKEYILREISQSVGYASLNRRVVEKLQTWFAEAALEHAEDMLDHADATTTAEVCSYVADLLKELGLLSRAGSLLEQGCGKLSASGCLETPHAAFLLHHLGCVKALCGAITEGMALLDEAYRIRQATGSLQQTRGAVLAMEMGNMKRRCGDLDGALRHYAEAQQIRETTGTMETSFGAALLLSKGLAQRDCGDLEAALASFGKAYTIHDAIGTLSTPDAASLLGNMGLVQYTLGRVDAATTSYTMARQCREATGTLHTSPGALLIIDEGDMKLDRGDLDGALASYAEARQIHEAIGAENCVASAKVLQKLGAVQEMRGAFPDAQAHYERGLAVRSTTGTLNTPDGAALLLDIGSLWKRRGHYERALESFQRAIGIHGVVGSLDTPGHATCLIAVGSLLRKFEDCSSALEHLDEARAILAGKGMLKSKTGVQLLLQQGLALRDLGRLDEALANLLEARSVLEGLGSLEGDIGAAVVGNVGVVHFALGDTAAAEASSSRAREMRQAAGTLETAGAARALMDEGNARHSHGDLPGAVACYAEADRIFQLLGALVTPERELLLSRWNAVQVESGDKIGSRSTRSTASQIRLSLTVQANAIQDSMARNSPPSRRSPGSLDCSRIVFMQPGDEVGSERAAPQTDTPKEVSNSCQA